MKLSIVAAMAENRVIGSNNKLPDWKAPGDLKRFQELTLGKVIIMGRKTFESIERALPKRYNIIVSSTLKTSNDYWVVSSLDKALLLVRSFEEGGMDFDPEVFVIGGSMLYKEALPLVSKIYLTRIKGEFKGDVYFPAFEGPSWILTQKVEHPTHFFEEYLRQEMC